MSPQPRGLAARIPAIIVDHWYVCGRKLQFSSEVIAQLHRETLRVTTCAYECPHGHHWHVGRPQTSATQSGMNHRRRQAARRALASYFTHRGQITPR